MTTSRTGAAPTTDAVERQQRALDLSAWGERFRFVQPHNLCFWVYLWVVGVGAYHAWTYFRPSLGYFGEAISIAAVILTVCALAWWAWLRHIDRWERQPGSIIVAALVWGGTAATFGIALTVNGAVLTLYAKLFGQDWAAHWAAGGTAPITEELAKLCGFILLLGLAPRLVRTANDGLILGAFIGLGFATAENYLYAANGAHANFGAEPVGSALQVAGVRIAASVISHPLFAALVCCGTLYLIGTAALQRNVVRGLALVATGMALHFIWDDAAGLGAGNGALVLLWMAGSVVVGFTVLYRTFRAARPQEHQFVRDILAPEIDRGTVSPDELEATLDRKTRKAWVHAVSGHRARRARKAVVTAVLDLTHDIADARGGDSPAVEHSRAELARLRDGAA